MERVRLATRRDIPHLAATLARAFGHDPFYSFVVGDAPERNQRMRDGWSGLLERSSNRLSHTYTTDDHAGVAIWYPPGYAGAGFVDSLRLFPALTRLVGGWRRLRNIARAIAALEERRAQHAPKPHFYLSALGVEPERQGEGIGTALLRPVLHEADAGRVDAYLETATARNVLLYERVGFDVVEELTLPGTDVHGWLMLRRPLDGALPASVSDQRSNEGADMEREDRPLADGTGMDREDDLPAMRPGDEESRTDEASGAEKTAVEGAAGIAATQRAFGGGAANAAGGIGTHVPTDEDEHMSTPSGADDSGATDPRGYRG